MSFKIFQYRNSVYIRSSIVTSIVGDPIVPKLQEREWQFLHKTQETKKGMNKGVY